MGLGTGAVLLCHLCGHEVMLGRSAGFGTFCRSAVTTATEARAALDDFRDQCGCSLTVMASSMDWPMCV